MESSSRELKAEKKAGKKREREKKVMEREECERKRLKREAQPIWPLVKFIEEMGEFPWDCHTNNWGFKEGSENFKLLSTKVPPPNNKIRTIRGLHIVDSDYDDDSSCGKASEESLPQLFTYNDVALALYEAAIDQGAGGNICSIYDVDQCKDDPTILDVKFNISAYY